MLQTRIITSKQVLVLKNKKNITVIDI